MEPQERCRTTGSTSIFHAGPSLQVPGESLRHSKTLRLLHAPAIPLRAAAILDVRFQPSNARGKRRFCCSKSNCHLQPLRRHSPHTFAKNHGCSYLSILAACWLQLPTTSAQPPSDKNKHIEYAENVYLKYIFLSCLCFFEVKFRPNV